MKNILAITALLLLFASCHKPVPSTSAPADEPYCDSLCLFAPGDYGSQYYRIPSTLCLADGSVISVCDKRKYSPSDLPQDIDIVLRRSTDSGRTWTEPSTLIAGTGVGHGYGDAAMVQCLSGDVLCCFAGGNGYFASSPSNPIRVHLMRSSDGGISWGEPEELTPLLWGDDSLGDYHGSFVASGNGLVLKHGAHAGRVLFAAALCRGGANVSDNYVLFSDDEGHTWHRSEIAYAGGDEAKLIELMDGTVLISVRRSGARGCNRSTDGGVHWGTQSTWSEMQANACNGDMLRLDDSTLLHSLPLSMQRENVGFYLSFDEGQHWTTTVPLLHEPSVYSSLTRLADGNIGCFVERGPDSGCELWYYRFNRAWLQAHAK